MLLIKKGKLYETLTPLWVEPLRKKNELATVFLPAGSFLVALDDADDSKRYCYRARMLTGSGEVIQYWFEVKHIDKDLALVVEP